MSDSIKQYMERPKFYANVDGTSELSFGLPLLGLALVSHIQAALPKDSIWQHGFYYIAFMYLVFIPFGCLGYFGPKLIKKYITYPRTGYVAYRRVKGFSWVRVALGAAIADGIAGVIVLALRHHATTPLRLGMAGACVAAYGVVGVIFARAQPWKWLVYGPLALGLVAMFLATDWSVADAAHRALLLASLTYVVSGAATLLLYLSRTLPPAAERE